MAGLLSLLFHFLVFMGWGGQREVSLTPPPIELEVRYVEALPAPATEIVEEGRNVSDFFPPPSSPDLVEPSPGHSSEKVQRSSGEEGHSPGAPGDVTPAVGSFFATPPPSGSDLPPEVVPPPPPERQAGDGVWLELTDAPLDLRPRLPPPQEDPGAAPVEPLPVERQIEERLERHFAEKRAEERALHRADPELHELRRSLDREFTVPIEFLDDVPAKSSLDLDRALHAYLAEAQTYGATGNPYGDGPLVPGARGSIADEAHFLFRASKGFDELGPSVSETTSLSRRLVSRIEVIHGADGSFVEARLVESSGVPRYDRLALQQAMETAKKRPGTQGARRTRWAFISRLMTTPMAPLAGCSLDQAFIPRECFYPGSKHLRTRVLLESIYDE